MNKIKRIPRNLGLTITLKEYHKLGSQIRFLKSQSPTQNKKNRMEIRELKIKRIEIIRRVRKDIIKEWINNNQTYNNIHYNTTTIAKYLNMNEDIVMKYMWDTLKRQGKVLGMMGNEESSRALGPQILKKILEGSAISAHQVSLLLNSQGDTYKPFLSSTVNQAITNLNSSHTPLLKLFELMTPKGTTLVQNNITNHPESPAQYLTTETAIKLINKSLPSMLEAPEMADEAIKSLPESIPNLHPRTQDLSVILLPKHLNPLPNPTSLKAKDSSDKGTESGPNTHEGRRSKQFGLVEDSEDFVS